MFKIFISYRSRDTRHIAFRIHETLERRFGKGAVFIDRARMRGGDAFPDRLDQELSEATVVLALLGERWCGTPADAAGALAPTGVHDPDDWVARELRRALAMKKVVIPVRIDHAELPGPAELPMDLQQLARLDTLRVDGGPDYAHDIERVIKSLAEHMPRPLVEIGGVFPGEHGDRCDRFDRVRNSFFPLTQPELETDDSDLFLLFLNASSPVFCDDLRGYFRGPNRPRQARSVRVLGIYDLFGRFDFLVKLSARDDAVSTIPLIIADLRAKNLIPPCGCAARGANLGGETTGAAGIGFAECVRCTALLLNVTHEYIHARPVHHGVLAPHENRAIKAFFRIYGWERERAEDIVTSCVPDEEHSKSVALVGVYLALDGDQSEAVAEYYVGCGGYYELVWHILAIEKSFIPHAERTTLVVMRIEGEQPHAREPLAVPA